FIPELAAVPVLYTVLEPHPDRNFTDDLSNASTTLIIPSADHAAYSEPLHDLGRKTQRVHLPCPHYTPAQAEGATNITARQFAVAVTTFTGRVQAAVDAAHASMGSRGAGVRVFMDEAYDVEVMVPLGGVMLHREGEMDGPTRWMWSVARLWELERDRDFYVIADDDTLLFLPSLMRTVEKLDPTVAWCVGGASETERANEHYMFEHEMAFGGGGVVLSRRAMELLAPSLGWCEWEFRDIFGGDGRLAECLVRVGVRIGLEPNMRQMDARGELFGMVEHLYGVAGWHRAHSSRVWPWEVKNQWKRLVDLDRRSRALWLRRYAWDVAGQNGNRPVVLTNGYTLVVHSGEETASELDLDVMEETYEMWPAPPGIPDVSDSGNAFSIPVQPALPVRRFFWDYVIYVREIRRQRSSTATSTAALTVPAPAPTPPTLPRPQPLAKRWDNIDAVIRDNAVLNAQPPAPNPDSTTQRGADPDGDAVRPHRMITTMWVAANVYRSVNFQGAAVLYCSGAAERYSRAVEELGRENVELVIEASEMEGLPDPILRLCT
ncbi:hypothetical protein HK101_010121, partial [Irineochytrium annulatum]